MYYHMTYNFLETERNSKIISGNHELTAYLKSEYLKTVIPKLYKK